MTRNRKSKKKESNYLFFVLVLNALALSIAFFEIVLAYVILGLLEYGLLRILLYTLGFGGIRVVSRRNKVVYLPTRRDGRFASKAMYTLAHLVALIFVIPLMFYLPSIILEPILAWIRTLNLLTKFLIALVIILSIFYTTYSSLY
mgnify:CR=1 FL=1